MELAISVRVAVMSLIDSGYTPREAVELINNMNHPVDGYVYADEMPRGKL